VLELSLGRTRGRAQTSMRFERIDSCPLKDAIEAGNANVEVVVSSAGHARLAFNTPVWEPVGKIRVTQPDAS